MSYYFNRRQDKPTFADKVAEYGIRRAMRPWLRRKVPTYVAVLVVPDTSHMDTYRAAGFRVLRNAEGEKDKEQDYTVDTFDNAGGHASTVRRMSSLEFLDRNIVFVTSGDEHVPESLRLAADFVVVVDPPRAEHFVAAALELGLGTVRAKDVEFLRTVPFSRLADVMTPGRKLTSAVRRLREVVDKEAAVQADTGPVTVQPPDRMPLLDLQGYGPAKDWGLRLAADIADWRAGDIGWDDVDSGALLSGPPGCGKTSFARVLAESCGMELVATSAAQWQSTGHLGDMLKAMRSDFAAAMKKAPCVLFVDELDSVGDRKRQNWNDDYKRQVVNGLLECMDGAVARDGVVVVGATNFPHLIDEALLRPGRLDVHVDIPLPDREARIAILRRYLGAAEILDLEAFGDASEGFSGAMIEKVARDARRSAREGRREPSAADVMASLSGRRPLSSDERWCVAVHEAGHAVVGVLLGSLPLDYVSISDAVLQGAGPQAVGRTVFEYVSPLLRTADSMRDEIAMMMGGLLAEEVVIGAFTTGVGGDQTSDLTIATDLATSMEAVLGMGNSLISEPASDPERRSRLRAADHSLRQRVEQALATERDRARELVIAYKKTIETLAGMLMARKRVEGREVVALVDKGETSPVSKDIGIRQVAGG